MEKNQKDEEWERRDKRDEDGIRRHRGRKRRVQAEERTHEQNNDDTKGRAREVKRSQGRTGEAKCGVKGEKVRKGKQIGRRNGGSGKKR